MSIITTLAVIAAVVVLLWIVVKMYGRAQKDRGGLEATSQAAKEAVDHAKQALEIDEDVSRLDGDSLYDELRKGSRNK